MPSYSIRRLLGICSLVAIVSYAWGYRNQALGWILICFSIGPAVAWLSLPTKYSPILGLFAAGFWSLMALVACLPVAYFIANAGYDAYPVAYFAVVIASVLGGYLGARVEQSRLRMKHDEEEA
ncbi:hypothetical protein HG15A2_43310 [Adhaeretor mobilis]|uniref:Uncharacterized protein n=1 Tax=Adhaeretor mobilis TaxID=1930276 RepID=A0A517N1H2_9BACT|nr:hypothetical protein HG15A2_43310 [Adhaeretor mobilis]